jgi:hypothetical protein
MQDATLLSITVEITVGSKRSQLQIPPQLLSGFATGSLLHVLLTDSSDNQIGELSRPIGALLQGEPIDVDRELAAGERVEAEVSLDLPL